MSSLGWHLFHCGGIIVADYHIVNIVIFFDKDAKTSGHEYPKDYVNAPHWYNLKIIGNFPLESPTS